MYVKGSGPAGPLREHCVLIQGLHPALEALELEKNWVAFSTRRQLPMGTRRDQPRRNPPANVHTSLAIPAWCTGEIPLEQVHTEFSKMSGPKIELLAKNGK
ncbi:MAG: hypothetical protein DMG34_05400 [Acidobacteria bacterium]|nr:MAG: hypothetical protein DMG34_05400 [Acidobacteriota bacterium]